MHADYVTTYFTEEKIENLFFIIIGIITIALALIFLLLIKYSFFKGMAIPLLAIGIMELSVGTFFFNNSVHEIAQVEHMLKNKSQLLQTHELHRMELVLKNCTIYKFIEIFLISIGVILFIVFYKSSQIFWKGFGLGLLIQAGLMLYLNMLSQQRLHLYIMHLNSSL